MPFPKANTKTKPDWLKVKFPSHQNYFYLSNLLKKKHIHTICQSAKCPNISECWSHKTAAFLILGNICTRACLFCAVKKGLPTSVESIEASYIAEAVSLIGLRYVVITSVTRDDLPDGGALHFANVIRTIKKITPETKVEALIPDFKGDRQALKSVIAANPGVVNHNLEVPENIYPSINRPKKNYKRSLKVLKNVKNMGSITKSGLMIGLGESKEDILRTFSDLGNISCNLLTIGQYLQPTKNHVPVVKYYSPHEFYQLKIIAYEFGFKEVISGPLVRSSYKAHKMYGSLFKNTA